jgi:DeoR/GlpR family transcriptional regulator of sugar metabolism
MLTEERRRAIAEHVREHGRAEVGELGEMFGVSRMTIRRDLATLAESGLLARSRGGALVPDLPLSTELPYAVKRRENEGAKRRIGKLAAGMVRNGDVVILDAGSTTFQIAAHLRDRRDVTVVTDDLKIAVELAPFPGVTVVSAGGVMEAGSYTVLGPETERLLGGIRANWVFLGADAVDPTRGASTRTFQEVAVKRAMLEAATGRALVVDGSKFTRQAFAVFCRPEELTALITDGEAPPESLAALTGRVRIETA